MYHLGAQSHVQVSFEMPESTGDVTGLGPTRFLEALRRSGIETKFYQASSSDLFGSSPPPQNESSPFAPRSPYAAAKLYAYWITKNYREAYHIFSTNGILFNHESPRRGETFLPRKVAMAIARIQAGVQQKLYVGNLKARRDWGYAPEYVEVMWNLLQLDEPGDYVIGLGESHSVEEFVIEAFTYAGLDWEKFVEIDPRYVRPTDVNHLEADATKARQAVGWSPKIRFAELTRIMVDAEFEAVGLDPIGEGVQIVREKFSGWHKWGSSGKGTKISEGSSTS